MELWNDVVNVTYVVYYGNWEHVCHNVGQTKPILKMGERRTKTDPQFLLKSHDPNKMRC